MSEEIHAGPRSEEQAPPPPGPERQSLLESVFTDEQRIRLQEWFRTKWKHRACPVCGTNAYAAPDRVWQVPEFRQGAIIIGGGRLIPMFPVTCNNCGYIVWVNAIAAGVLLRPEGKDS